METVRKILFYGDSNTYGFDPADWAEGRFPAEIRWTDILQRECKDRWTVISEGLNGRKIPELPRAESWILRFLEPLDEDDVFAVMLGTNDLLVMAEPDAADVAERMNLFLAFLTERKAADTILLMAPVQIGYEDAPDPQLRRYYTESRRLGEEYRLLAEKYGTRFADAGSWSIRLAFDQVHLSEEGSRQFAREMKEVLRKW